MSMIGEVTLKINHDVDTDKLYVQTGADTIEAPASNTLTFASLSGLETFTVLKQTKLIANSDLIFIIVVVILILILSAAVFFLLKKIKKY